MIFAPNKDIWVPRRQRGYIVPVGFGYSSTPNFNLTNLASSYTDEGIASTTYAVDIVFRGDASVDVLRDVGSNLNDEQTVYSTNVPLSYVRCEYVSGDNMTAGDAVDTWHALSTTPRRFTMRHTTGGGFDQLIGIFKLHLSRSASGPADHSTGNITVTVGETS